MFTRLSSTQIADSSVFGIQQAYNRFDIAQRKVNTGKQLQTPSDNPTGTAQTLEFRERVSELDQFGRPISQAQELYFHERGRSGSVTSLTRQARTIGVQAASDNLTVEPAPPWATSFKTSSARSPTSATPLMAHSTYSGDSARTRPRFWERRRIQICRRHGRYGRCGFDPHYRAQ